MKKSVVNTAPGVIRLIVDTLSIAHFYCYTYCRSAKCRCTEYHDAKHLYFDVNFEHFSHFQFDLRPHVIFVTFSHFFC